MTDADRPEQRTDAADIRDEVPEEGTESDTTAAAADTDDAAPEHESRADSAQPTEQSEIDEATELANGGADTDETGASAGTGAAGSAGSGRNLTPPHPSRRPVGRSRRPRSSISYPPQSDVTVATAGAEEQRQKRGGFAAVLSSSSMRLPIALAIVAVLLAGFAVFAGLRASSASAQAENNSALVDSKATNEVKQQATNALNTMFSFNYKDPSKTKKAAKPLLYGKGPDKYGKILKVLEQNGPKAKFSLNSAVVSMGVQRLEGDHARVVAMLSETYSTGGSKAKSAVGMMRADLRNTKGKDWKVSDLKMLSG